MARISLVIAEAHSLKEKRMVLRRIKDRVRERLGVFVSEVGEADVWQRAELGLAVASGDRQKALALIDDVVRVAVASGGAAVAGVAKDAITFEGEAEAWDAAVEADRAGAGDKLVGGDDWVPDAWRAEVES